MVNTLSIVSSALLFLAISPVQAGGSHRSNRRAHSNHSNSIARAANLVRVSSSQPDSILLEKRAPTIKRRSTNVQKRCKNKATSSSLVASSTSASASTSTSAAPSTTAAIGNVGSAPKSSSSAAAEPTTTPKAATSTTSSKAEATTTSHKAAATTTSTKAAATTAASSSSSGNSLLTGTKSGEGTFYGTGLGACGITNSDADYIAAVSHILFDEYPGYDGANPNNNPICGKKVTALRNGKSVTVEITDRCTACAEFDLDFSPTAFDILADATLGRVDITWTWN